MENELMPTDFRSSSYSSKLARTTSIPDIVNGGRNGNAIPAYFPPSHNMASTMGISNKS